MYCLKKMHVFNLTWRTLLTLPVSHIGGEGPGRAHVTGYVSFLVVVLTFPALLTFVSSHKVGPVY